MTWWMWLAIPLAYFLIAVWFWRQFAWRIAYKEAREWGHSGHPDGGNVALGMILGAIQALAWPLTLFLLAGVHHPDFYGFLREPGVSRRERELREREARIAALEREVGVR